MSSMAHFFVNLPGSGFTPLAQLALFVRPVHAFPMYLRPVLVVAIFMNDTF